MPTEPASLLKALLMPLDFRPSPTSRRGAPKSPPNYLSRTVQRKILMLGGLLFLVILLMQEARKPSNWHWLWALQGQPVPATQDEIPDTRVRDRQQPGSAAVDGGPLIYAQPEDRPPPSPTLPKEAGQIHDDQQEVPLHRARLDAWSRLLGDFAEDDRQILLRSLKRARDGQPLDADDARPWQTLVSDLDDGWQQYLDDARQAIHEDEASLTDAERQRWSELIARLESQWKEEFKPVLTALTPSTSPQAADRQTLLELQSALDAVLLTRIEDNTVFRYSEKDIWFRLLEDLAARDAGELRERSTGSVSFVQLYRQPDQYRGKLVTVSGTARLAHYREAPENLYGIPGYYMLWLQPVAANSPIVIYCLQLPEGFPDVRAMEAQGRKPELDEDLEITGYFFKRWAYRAQDGTRLAPLLLAKTPTWTARAAPIAHPDSLPGPLYWIALLGGTAIFGAACAGGLYWLSVRSVVPRRRREPLSLSEEERA